MKILLLNNNPVVNKLVTLSAQKTSNSLDTSDSIQNVEPKNYDLLIIDDALYGEEVMDELKSKIKYNKSLYICSKDAKYSEEFTKTLKKPFLPTDLVEILITLAKDIQGIDLDKVKNDTDFDDSDIELSDLDHLNELEELDPIDDFQENDILESVNLDKKEDDDIDFDELDDDNLEGDELEQEIDFDEDDILELESTQDKADSILDKDELKEVKTLLEENEMEEFDSDDFDLDTDMQNIEIKEDSLETDETLDNAFDELDLQDDDDLEIQDDDSELSQDDSLFEDDLELDDEKDELAVQEISKDSFDDEDPELDDEGQLIDNDEFGFEEELKIDDDLNDEEIQESRENEETELKDDGYDDISEFEDDFKDDDIDNLLKEDDVSLADDNVEDLEDLESQIENAVKELSDEDLQSEVDEDMLIDIDSLTSRDLKLAIGEEVPLESEPYEEEKNKFDKEKEPESLEVQQEDTSESSNDGVEALKKLLKALSNEDIAASLKGMKVNINITLGDK